MAENTLSSKSTRLFILLGGFFVANALIAEFIGVKIFSLEQTLGLEPVNLKFFGKEGLSFYLTAGVLLWPLVFVLTDVINEYFGVRGVRILSLMAAGLITYAFLAVYLAMALSPAGFWILRETEEGPLNMELAFNAVFAQGLWIIAGSLIAFLVGQIVDVVVFHTVKRFTGERFVWARATGSTFVSQFIDSYVVLFIAFYMGPTGWPLELVLAIGTVNYIYKFVMAIVLTPLIYLAHHLIDRYLGPELSAQLRRQAHERFAKEIKMQ